MPLVDEMLAGLPLSITFGTKLPPTRDIDPGTKWEKEARRAKEHGGKWQNEDMQRWD